MARPLRIEYPGAFYHVTTRGNEKKDIFRSNRDREKFLSYLEAATERYGAVIHAYCLMSNHYLLMLETPQGNLSQIMKHINGSYAAYRKKRKPKKYIGNLYLILLNRNMQVSYRKQSPLPFWEVRSSSVKYRKGT